MFVFLKNFSGQEHYEFSLTNTQKLIWNPIETNCRFQSSDENKIIYMGSKS